jgi:very-short-patch-repair endonuclease
LDFYFSFGKIGIEADGRSHRDELQAAKDEWLDKLMLERGGIKVLRFRNEQILESVHVVVGEIAAELCARHNWPRKINEDFYQFRIRCSSPDSWLKLTTEFIETRKTH